MMPDDMPLFLDEDGHVPAAEMARYIDGTCDRGARASVTRHLADCEECREELTALRRLVPPRSRLTTRVGALLGAAAAVTLITLSWPGTLTPRTEEEPSAITRASASVPELDVPLPVAFPEPGALVSRDSVRLIWHVAGVDASYEVTLQDESGGVVFKQTTTDTATIVPASAFRTQAARDSAGAVRAYYWSVDARLLNGRSARTGLHRLRVR